MRFATITPDRGDRPELLAFCKKQLERMNTKPEKSYFIDYPPVSSEFDLTARIKAGVAQAKADGFDLVFIIENDDYYPANYFDGLSDKFDFYGSVITTYYNLRNNTHQGFVHINRSSLFTTGFKISALDKFTWPNDDYRNLDIIIWGYAMGKKRRGKKVGWMSPKAIGIKHGQGLLGGRGHSMTMKNIDKDWEWLAMNTDPEAYAFYKTLKL